MNTRIEPIDSSECEALPASPSWLDRLARRIVFSKLAKIEYGQIVLSESGVRTVFGQRTDDYPLSAHLEVRDPRFYSDVAFGGSIGAGEAYMSAYWVTGELNDLLRIMLRNRSVLDNLERRYR